MWILLLSVSWGVVSYRGHNLFRACVRSLDLGQLQQLKHSSPVCPRKNAYGLMVYEEHYNWIWTTQLPRKTRERRQTSVISRLGFWLGMMRVLAGGVKQGGYVNKDTCVMPKSPFVIASETWSHYMLDQSDFVKQLAAKLNPVSYQRFVMMECQQMASNA
jgi:hypothetical protein